MYYYIIYQRKCVLEMYGKLNKTESLELILISKQFNKSISYSKLVLATQRLSSATSALAFGLDVQIQFSP